MLNADAALSRSALIALAIGECRRKRGEYRKAALDALRMALEKMHDVDVAELVLQVVEAGRRTRTLADARTYIYVY